MTDFADLERRLTDECLRLARPGIIYGNLPSLLGEAASAIRELMPKAGWEVSEYRRLSDEAVVWKLDSGQWTASGYGLGSEHSGPWPGASAAMAGLDKPD